LWFEINGAAASLRWFQERQNELWIGRRHAANQTLLKDPALLGPESRRYAHLPAGHQEAWSDAFRNLIADIYARIAGQVEPTNRPCFPTFDDGYHAACLVDAILDSHRRGGVWTTIHPKSEIVTT
jgi:predicted dehydrogenase